VDSEPIIPAVKTRALGSALREIILVVLILFAALSALFWKVLFLDHVQVPADILYEDPILREAAPPDFQRPQNPLLSDNIHQFHVWHRVAAEFLRTEGRMPLWNPYVLCGQPLLANAQSALFYPPNLLLRFLSAETVANTRIAFNVVVAGIFTFLFCKSLGITFGGALLASVAFAFSGPIMVGPGHPYVSCLAAMPLSFWAGETILRGRRAFAWAAIAGTGLGLSILGGHPETSFHVFCVFFLYFVARILIMEKTPKEKIRAGAGLAGALVAGILVGAVQWIPFASFLAQGDTPTRSAIGLHDTLFYSPHFSRNIWMLLTLLLPNAFGNPADGTYFRMTGTYNNYLEQAMYCGLVPLIFAAGAVAAFWKRRHPAAILWWLWLVCVLVAFRAPFFEFVNHLPVFDMVNNNRFKWISSFLAAALAGVGFDLLVARAPDDGSRARAMRGCGAIWSITAILLIMTAAAKFFVFPLGTLPSDTIAHHVLHELFSIRQYRTVASLVAFLGASAILFGIFRRPGQFRAIQTCAVALTLCELIAVAWQFNTTVPRETVFRDTDLTRMLREEREPYRIVSGPPFLWPNYGAVYGISHLGAYELPIFRRYTELYRAQGGTERKQIWSPDWPMADFMNVKFLITDTGWIPSKFEPVRIEPGYALFRNRDVLPRAYCVREYDVLSPKAALERLTSGAFDFRRKAVLEESLSADQNSRLTEGTRDSAPRRVTVTSAKLDRVELHVEDGDAALLVMSDVFAPGWNALLDDRPTELLRANYAFRGVFVPRGDHRITFAYRPADYLVGAALSCLGLAFVALGFLQLIRPDK
jgi:hypothetical protein